MNKEWNHALNEISDEHINEAALYQKRRHYWFGAVAAVLAIAIGWAALRPQPHSQPQTPILSGTPVVTPTPGNPQSPGTLQLTNLVAAPEYPKMAQCPDWDEYDDYEEYETAYSNWQESCRNQYDQPDGYADNLDGFFRRSITEFLSGDGNRTYSPLNVYLAMAMLAETTGGNSRQQILDLLGAESIEALRTQAGQVWNAHYRDDGRATSLLANSLWLDSEYSFKNETLQTLANSYYASAFHGDLGTDPLNEQLRTWINSQTGNLLSAYTKDLKLSPDTVFALASTAYFSADWSSAFSKEDNTQDLFHCEGFDQITEFMNTTIELGTYYWGTDFGAVRLDLTGDNAMWLILPDEGKTVEDVLNGSEYWDLIRDPGAWKNLKSIKIHLSMPKFDISSQSDLIEGMKNLGLSEIFDERVSDFTPLTDSKDLFVSKIDHAARVAVDEEGVIAAAYTVIEVYASGVPTFPDEEIDFTLDRPFFFAVTSQDNLPLFTGVVEQP